MQGVYLDRLKGNQWLYLPIVAFIRLLAKFVPEPRQRDRWTKELVFDPVLLGGNMLLIHSIRQLVRQ
jgi:hypothetical protein